MKKYIVPEGVHHWADLAPGVQAAIARKILVNIAPAKRYVTEERAYTVHRCFTLAAARIVVDADSMRIHPDSLATVKLLLEQYLT